jgi:hypothetical protein
MEGNMMDHGLITRCMVMEYLYGQIIESILEISQRIRGKDLEYSFGQMIRYIMAIGLIVSSMERELLLIVIIQRSWESLRKAIGRDGLFLIIRLILLNWIIVISVIYRC